VKIALLTETYPPCVDGVSHVTSSLAKELSKEHDVKVVTFSDHASVETNGLTVHRLRSQKLNCYPQYRYRIIPPYRPVLKILKDFKPDVVHTQTSLSLGAAGEWAARKMHVPMVSTFHTDMEEFVAEIVKNGHIDINVLARKLLLSWPGRKLTLKMVEKVSYPAIYSYFGASDAVTSPSDAVTNLMVSRGVKESKIHKVPNFIERDPASISAGEFRNRWDVEGFMVLHVGRLSWEKRIHKILQTAKRIPEATFVITSDGPLAGELHKQAADMGLDNVRFTGFLPYDELYGAYKASDMFLAASPYETFNISAAQSLAFGKPIVGVNRMGMTEFIKHGRNGFLVSWDEHEVEMYEHYIRELMDDGALRGRLGKASRRLASKFDKKKIVGQFVDIYGSTEPNGKDRWKYVYVLSLLMTLMRAARI
jgi:1,2-diacylglycerol 3-alpha-glucosyltransferase